MTSRYCRKAYNLKIRIVGRKLIRYNSCQPFPLRLPYQVLTIRPKDYLLYTPGKIFLKTPDKLPNLLSPHRLSYPQLPSNILPRLLYKTQHGTEPLLPPILRIMPFATSLLLAIDRFYGRVYINIDTPLFYFSYI